MSQLKQSTKDFKFKPYKPPAQAWFPTNAALTAALTRIENALDTLDRLADAIEKHLGMGSPCELQYAFDWILCQVT